MIFLKETAIEQKPDIFFVFLQIKEHNSRIERVIA